MTDPEFKNCPECNEQISIDAVLCIDCGFHLEKGHLKTEEAEDTVIVEPPPQEINEAAWILGYGVAHILLAMICTIIAATFVRTIVSGYPLYPNHYYSYCSFELIIPAFLLGILFCNTAQFPFRGFIGVAIGFFIAMIIVKPPESGGLWPVYIALSGLAAIVPASAELVGIMCGKWIDQNLR